MNCVGNNSKKDVIYKGRRIGEGENYMLDNNGNYIDSITDNTKKISELSNQLKELLSKGDEENDKLTKQFAEIQDKINQSVDEKLKELSKASSKQTASIQASTLVSKITKETFTDFTGFSMSGRADVKKKNFYYSISWPNLIDYAKEHYKPSGDDILCFRVRSVSVNFTCGKWYEIFKWSKSSGDPKPGSIKDNLLYKYVQGDMDSGGCTMKSVEVEYEEFYLQTDPWKVTWAF